jgi:hypothetical protein
VVPAQLQYRLLPNRDCVDKRLNKNFHTSANYSA